MNNKIQEIIKSKGLKSGYVIKKSGISRTAFYSIAAGESVPSLSNARKICDALDEDLDKVFPNDKFDGTSTEETAKE